MSSRSDNEADDNDASEKQQLMDLNKKENDGTISIADDDDDDRWMIRMHDPSVVSEWERRIRERNNGRRIEQKKGAAAGMATRKNGSAKASSQADDVDDGTIAAGSDNNNNNDDDAPGIPHIPDLLQIPWKLRVVGGNSKLSTDSVMSAASYPSFSYLEIRQKQNYTWCTSKLAEGVEHAKNGRRKEAELCYKEGLQLVPTHAPLLVAYGALLASSISTSHHPTTSPLLTSTAPTTTTKRLLEEAIQKLKQAIDIDPHVPNGKDYLKQVLEKQRQLEEKRNGNSHNKKTLSLQVKANQRALQDAMSEQALGQDRQRHPRKRAVNDERQNQPYPLVMSSASDGDFDSSSSSTTERRRKRKKRRRREKKHNKRKKEDRKRRKKERRKEKKRRKERKRRRREEDEESSSSTEESGDEGDIAVRDKEDSKRRMDAPSSAGNKGNELLMDGEEATDGVEFKRRKNEISRKTKRKRRRSPHSSDDEESH